MRAVWHCLRWSSLVMWRETRDVPGGLVLFALLGPVAVALCCLIGWWVGEAVGKSTTPGSFMRDALVIQAGILCFLSLWAEGADYVTARRGRSRQGLTHLPLNPAQLYAIPFLEVFGVLFGIVAPYALCFAAGLIAYGKPQLAPLAIAASLLITIGSLAVSRVVALAVVSVPPRYGGWSAAILLPLVTLTVAARPLGLALRHSDGPAPEAWPHTMTGSLPGAELLAQPDVVLASLALLTAFLLALDYVTYRNVVLRNPGLFFARATQGGDPASWSRVGRWLDRRLLPQHGPLRALLRKEFLWLLRQRPIHLVPLVFISIGAITATILELLFPLAVLRPQFYTAIQGTGGVVAGVLIAFGALHAATSLPAEEGTVRRVLETPLSAREILHLRSLSVLPVTVLTWGAGWLIGAAAIGGEIGLPPWLKWGAGPVLVVLAAGYTAFAGTAIGTLCPKRSPEHPLFSVNLLGLGAQLTVSLGSLALGLICIMGCSVSPTWAILPVLCVPLLAAIVVFLRTEARRKLRSLRLEPW